MTLKRHVIVLPGAIIGDRNHLVLGSARTIGQFFYF